MIYIYKGFDMLEKAEKISDPKHIWIDTDRVVVTTGNDMPTDTQQEAAADAI